MNTTNQKEYCIIHCRVSSSKQSQQGESLDVQENVCRSIAVAKNWSIEPHGKIWKESFSGRKENRPIFEEILNYLRENPGKVKYYLFRAIDRFTRGGTFSYETMKRELSKLGVEMVDSYGIIQPSQNTLTNLGFEYTWSKYFPSEITELVMASTAKTEVTNILTRTIGQEIRLTQQGFKVRASQDGFLNQEKVIDGKKKVIQVPDPERAKYIIEMFNLRAMGAHSDEEIVAKINAMGYRSKTQHHWDKAHEKIIGSRGGISLTVKQLQAIIKRPIYCGFVCEKWTRYQPVKAQYDGLVSIDTFNQANRGKVLIQENEDKTWKILYDSHLEKTTIKKTRYNSLFPYKHVILCPQCNKPFMGSSPVGKSGKGFATYHCSRKTHKYFGIPKKTFEDSVEHYIRNLKFKPQYLNSLEVSFLNKYREREQEIVKASSTIHQSISELKAEQAMKLESYVSSTSSLIKGKLEKEIEDLEVRIKDAGTESQKIEVTESDIKLFIKKVKYVMEHPEEMLLNPDNPRAQESLFGLVFEEFPTFTQIMSGTPKLSLIFEVSSDFKPNQDVLGCLMGFEPILRDPQTLVLTVTL